MNEIDRTRPFHVKAGLKSTEFWLAAIVVIFAMLTADSGHKGFEVNEAVALAAAALTSIGYGRSRADVKAGR